jgi:hypothetical protein
MNYQLLKYWYRKIKNLTFPKVIVKVKRILMEVVAYILRAHILKNQIKIQKLREI